jgi:hypothetical protein
LDAGIVSDGLYRNQGLGFSCRIPAGWVLRTEEMNAKDAAANPTEAAPQEDTKNSSGTKKSSSESRVLLAAFSRPPEAKAEDVNASILIAAESAALYPGLKDAVQYFGPVNEVVTAQGFVLVEKPYDFVAETKTLVRADFQKDVGSRIMRQSTLVMLERGWAVSFTFIGGTEDEVEELVKELSFNPSVKPHP